MNLNGGIPVLFRSYDTPNEPAIDCEIWEAARATSATLGIFKPMEIAIHGMKQPYIGGCSGNNNPTSLLFEEAKNFFPSRPIVLISIGAGHPATIEIPQSPKPKAIATVMKGIATDCEKTHEDNVRRFQDTPNTYFRFNVQQGMQGLGHEDWSKLPNIRAHATNYVRTEDVNIKLTDAVKIFQSKCGSLGRREARD